MDMVRINWGVRGGGGKERIKPPEGIRSGFIYVSIAYN